MRLDDNRVGQPTALPGWTRGHLLTHLARQAEGFGRLLAWARTGVRTPMYESWERRNADIAA
ncbi:MAG: maleylpyruvate isomerase N-terminal domain-containing protein, partial [Candidatus Dormiibacterota bacterium]